MNGSDGRRREAHAIRVAASIVTVIVGALVFTPTPTSAAMAIGYVLGAVLAGFVL